MSEFLSLSRSPTLRFAFIWCRWHRELHNMTLAGVIQHWNCTVLNLQAKLCAAKWQSSDAQRRGLPLSPSLTFWHGRRAEIYYTPMPHSVANELLMQAMMMRERLKKPHATGHVCNESGGLERNTKINYWEDLLHSFIIPVRLVQNLTHWKLNLCVCYYFSLMDSCFNISPQ